MLPEAEFDSRQPRSILAARAESNEQPNAEEFWKEIQQLLWRALAPFPEARVAVARELEAAGGRK